MIDIKDNIPKNLPKKYRELIFNYIVELKNSLKENLKLVLLIGSSSSGNIVSGWSDIDIIVVLKEYKMEYVDIIKKLVERYDIKIGNTIYSLNEFENKRIDPKTYYYLLLVQENYIKIQYKSNDIMIPQISIDECKQEYQAWLMEHIHSYKRIWLYKEITDKNIREIFKNTYLIMKAILIINNYRPQNYKEVFSLYSKKFKYKKLNFEKFIKDYQNENYNREEIIDFSKEFSENISNTLSLYEESK